MMSSETTIAVLEDNHFVRDALDMALTTQGRRVQAYETGEQLLQALTSRQCAPDVIVLDLGLPGISGLEVQRRLNDIGSEIPIIVLTAHPETQDARMAGAQGASTLLTKPANYEQMIAAIDSALEHSRCFAPVAGSGEDQI